MSWKCRIILRHIICLFNLLISFVELRKENYKQWSLISRLTQKLLKIQYIKILWHLLCCRLHRPNFSVKNMSQFLTQIFFEWIYFTACLLKMLRPFNDRLMVTNLDFYTGKFYAVKRRSSNRIISFYLHILRTKMQNPFIISF